MKINKKTFPFIGLLIFFSVVYMFVAVKPTRNAFHFDPKWTIDVTDVSSETLVPTSSHDKPFKLGSYIGYYSPEGGVSSIQTLEERGAISNHYMAPFSSNANNISFYVPDGQVSGVLEGSGFPFFDEDRIFLFLPTGSSFSVHSSNGKEKWRYENYVPITAFHSNEEGVVAGYADGKIVVFSPEGRIRHEFYPGGSEYEVIFGASLSASGKYVACLSGLDNQRVVISDVGGSKSKITLHTYVENQTIEQSLVYFSANEKYVFSGVKNSVIIVNLDTKEEMHVDIKGKVITIKEVYNGEYYFVLSKDREQSTISVLNENLYKVGSFSFEEENTFLDTDEENVYIGNGTTISKIYINQER